MKHNLYKNYLAIILGATTLFLFAAIPYILDLIEPAKSIGQVIGENAKDLIDSLNGENRNRNSQNSKREIWLNILTILAFILLAITMAASIYTIGNNAKKWHGIAGIILSATGLAIYISHLAIGLIGFIVITVLIVGIVILEGL